MIRSILVPVDGSTASICAQEIALNLAGIADAALIGLFVKDDSRFYEVDPRAALAAIFTAQMVPVTLRDPAELCEIESSLQEQSEELKAEFLRICQQANVRASFKSLVGSPGEIISILARTVDFVVMGNSHIHRDSSKSHSGKTTYSLLHRTTRPVLVVGDEPAGESSMVIAYDGSAAAERALRASAEFAVLSDLNTVKLLTVEADPSQGRLIQQTAIEYLSSFDFDLEPVVVGGVPEEAIVQFTSDTEPSCLALGAYGSSFFQEKLFGSTTEYVLSHVNSAILLTS